jgi:lipopolysaccharide export system permease protein
MLLFDRYLLLRFFRTLLICFVSVAGLFVVIDVFTNLEEFIALAESHGGMLPVLLGYYGPRVAWIFDRTGPFVVLLAAMFTVAWLHRSNEMTALFAAGVSPRRIAKPLLAAAVVVALLGLANREWLIPSFRDRLSRNAQDLVSDRGRPLFPQWDERSDINLNGQLAFVGERRISNPQFSFEEPKAGFGRRVVAENAYYRGPSGNRPGGYLMERVSEPKNIAELPSLVLAGQPTVLTPSDHSWLKADQCFVVSDVEFEQLAGGATWRQFSSTWRLVRGLRSRGLNFGADVRVEVHARMVRPLLDLVLLLLGLPLAFAADQRNVFLAAGKGVLLALGFITVVIACQGMGATFWVRPSLAAWSPLLVFVPLAMYLNEPLRK